MSIYATKLPPMLTKMILSFSLLGMLLGVVISYFNNRDFGQAVLISVAVGLLFGMAAKYLLVKMMLAHMETKLEIAAKEKEEARLIESAKREERKKKADEESARIKAEEEALKAAAKVKVPEPSSTPSKPAGAK